MINRNKRIIDMLDRRRAWFIADEIRAVCSRVLDAKDPNTDPELLAFAKALWEEHHIAGMSAFVDDYIRIKKMLRNGHGEFVDEEFPTEVVVPDSELEICDRCGEPRLHCDCADDEDDTIGLFEGSGKYDDRCLTEVTGRCVVDDWAADALDGKGFCVTQVNEVNIWHRTTSGNAVWQDEVWLEIAFAELERRAMLPHTEFLRDLNPYSLEWWIATLAQSYRDDEYLKVLAEAIPNPQEKKDEKAAGSDQGSGPA